MLVWGKDGEERILPENAIHVVVNPETGHSIVVDSFEVVCVDEPVYL